MKTASWFTYTGPGRVSISRGTPRGTSKGYKLFKKLAPGPWFNSVDEETYIKLFYEQLEKLDPVEIVEQIEALHQNDEPVLLCYENPNHKTWCHRAIVSVWLHDQLGLVVPEVGFEENGFGGGHPLLPPTLTNSDKKA